MTFMIECGTGFYIGVAFAWPFALVFWYIAIRILNVVTKKKGRP